LVCMGDSHSVPRFLRLDGFVRNRRISLVQLHTIIKDVWASKAVSKAAVSVPLDEFLYFFLRRRFTTQRMIAEWGYSILDALDRYASLSAKSRLFRAVLRGDRHEMYFHQQQSCVEEFRQALANKDKEVNGAAAKGWLTSVQVEAAAKHFFTAVYPKRTIRTKRILRALKEDEGALKVGAGEEADEMSPDGIYYNLLFLEDQFGHSGKLVLTIEEEFLQDVEDYLEALFKATVEGKGTATAKILTKGFAIADPTKPQNDVKEFVKIAMGDQAVLPVREALRRLVQGSKVLRRSGMEGIEQRVPFQQHG